MPASPLRDMQIACALLEAAKVLARKFKDLDPNEMTSEAWERLQRIPDSVLDADVVKYVNKTLKNVCISELRRRKYERAKFSRFAAEKNVVDIEKYMPDESRDPSPMLPFMGLSVVDLFRFFQANSDLDAVSFIELVAMNHDLVFRGKCTKSWKLRVTEICQILGWDLRRTKRTVRRVGRAAQRMRDAMPIPEEIR